MTNEERARRAERALTTYRGSDRPDECHYQDLITDLLHAAERQGLNLTAMIGRAAFMYLDEHGNPDQGEPVPLPDVARELPTAAWQLRELIN